MFFLFLLSILQTCFIPGFIIYTLLNKETDKNNIFFIPAISFGLSLVVNYFFVSILAGFQIYLRPSLFIILAVEFLIIILLNSRIKNIIQSFRAGSEEIKNDLLEIKNTRSIYSLFRSELLIISFLLLLSLIIVMLFDAGKIFSEGDSVFSWNRWAVDFYNNRLPAVVYHYPQLIPANWSISYVLCGYPMQYVPRAIMPLFLIIPVYSLIVLGIKQKSTVFFSASILLFLALRGLNWRDGWVDVPVAFFSIMVFICFILLKEEKSENGKWNFLIIAAILACGCAVTKQAGIFLLLTYPVLAWILAPGIFHPAGRKILKLGIILIVLMIFIVIPFYFYAELALRKGTNASEIGYVTKEIYNGASYMERFRSACIFFSYVFKSKLLFVILLFPFLLSLSEKTFRSIFFFFVLPYSLIWAFFFSYDIRNSSLIIPYFCLGIGIGLDIIFRKISNSIPVNEKIK
jgi:hypothetical protein